MGSLTIVRDDDDDKEDNVINSLKVQPFIIQAKYGCGRHMIDVTERVKHIKSEFFHVSNQLFSDPCPGIIKELVITFNDDHQQIYSENNIVNALTYEISNSFITSAIYGYQSRVIDVTAIVLRQNDTFTVCNELFTDPCPGVIKSLTITLDQGQHIFPEHSQVDPTQWMTASRMRIYV